MTRRLTLLLLLITPLAVYAAPIAQRDGMAPPTSAAQDGAVAGPTHFILEPDHPLRDDEKADLAARGIEVLDVVPGGRYMVRVARDADFTEDRLVRSLEILTTDRKLHRSAYLAARSRAFAPLFIVFQADASFEDARRVIEGVGGTILKPLSVRFQQPRSVRAMIPSSELRRLAANDSVRSVVGFSNLRRESHNATSATLSSVTPVQTAPYNLTGEGLTITYFELGPADVTHREFQGRLTTHFDTTQLSDHATHVAGTMSAAGLDPKAKGMAPAAIVHQYEADNDLDFLDLKEEELPRLNSVADNNSWGYILGWCRGKSICPDDWIWTGGDELIGGYFELNTALDAIARDNNVLMVHSSGNDGSNPGPSAAPFSHLHLLDGHDEDATFCYSANGSGTDCLAPCVGNDSQGNPLCEITRHPVNAPFLSVGALASSKNVIAVGATDGSKTITSYSSRGPTRDGRVKPDVVARGGVGSQLGQVYSTFPNGTYGGSQGTSMSSPVVTGVSALLTEQWRKTFSANPFPHTIKALLIGAAEDRGNAGPDYTYGFGFVNAKAAVDLIIADNRTGSRIKIDSVGNGQEISVPLTVSSTQNLRVTIVWSDPEVLPFGEDYGFPTLFNDLDLKVVDAAGTTTRPFVLNKLQPEALATKGVNTVDNVEVVEIANAAPGAYQVVVSGRRIEDGPQQFSLVSNAGLGAVVPPCTDVYEPNESQTASVSLISGSAFNGRACTASDVDVFKARVTAPGTISVTVTAGDTPLRVALSGPSVASSSVDVPAGATRTVTTSASSAPTDVFVTVTPTGTIGSDPFYQVSATFPLAGATPRRAVRH